MDAPDRQRVGVALVLSVALAVAAALSDFGAPAFEHDTEVMLHTFEEAIDGEEGAAHAVTHGEPFDVSDRMALAVTLDREESTGWAGVLVGLVPQGDTDADVRELPFELLPGESLVRAHVSDVTPGRYLLRVEGATDAASAPASVHVRVTGGRRTPWPLLLAGALLWAPAVVGLLRRKGATRDVPSTPDS